MNDAPLQPPAGWSATPLAQLMLARFRTFFREPAAVFWVYGFPLIMAIALGLAFRNRPVEKTTVDVRSDGPGGLAAAELVKAALEADPRFVVAIESSDAAKNRLRVAKTDLVVTPGTGGDLVSEYMLDPNRSESVLARTAVNNVVLRRKSPDWKPPAEAIMSEPGDRYIDFLIPGLLGLNLMGGGLWGVGFVTVDMRVRKLLKRYLATPMRRSDFLLSLMLSRLVLTLIEVCVLLAFSYVFFDIRVRGNVLAFVVLMVVGGFAFAGLGLLAASRAKTIETISGLMNAIMLPMYILSGVFFSSERFPNAMQPFIQLLPLTVLNDGLRAIMNDGSGFAAIVYPLSVLIGWGIVCFALAFRYFRWR